MGRADLDIQRAFDELLTASFFTTTRRGSYPDASGEADFHSARRDHALRKLVSLVVRLPFTSRLTQDSKGPSTDDLDEERDPAEPASEEPRAAEAQAAAAAKALCAVAAVILWMKTVAFVTMTEMHVVRCCPCVCDCGHAGALHAHVAGLSHPPCHMQRVVCRIRSSQR